MTHKGGNFSEFTQLDNPWLPRLLCKEPINPGQLISIELLRWVDGKTTKENASLPYPQLTVFLLENFNIKSTEGVDNKKCLPMDSKNLGKMGVVYNKPVRATQSGSQGGSVSHTSQPSTFGARDQEADSRPSTSRGPRVSAAQKALLQKEMDELSFKLPDPLMTPLREEFHSAYMRQRWRIKRLESRLDGVEAKLDLLLTHLLAPPFPPRPPPPPPPSPPSPPPQNDSPDHHHSHTQSSPQDSPHHHHSSDHSPSHSHHSSSSDQPSDHDDHISSPPPSPPRYGPEPPCYPLLYFHPGPLPV